MAKRKIVWTKKANLERKEILEYWINRNKSKSFSIKLNRLIINDLKLLSLSPFIGRKTKMENVRVRIVHDYLIFYEILKEEILILTVWDGRKDSKTLIIK